MVKHFICSSVAVLALSVGSVGTLAAVRPLPAPSGAPVVAQPSDTMTRYRDLAGEALAAFKSGDASVAKAKSRELEKAWDGEQKALRAKSPDVWKAVDDAMDAFIKPLMKGGKADPGAVQAAYDAFIAKLDSAATM